MTAVRNVRFPLIAASVTALSMVALSGCGSSGSGSSSTASGGISVVNPGKLTICTHVPYKPFEYRDAKGKVIGFDIDMIELAAKKLGLTQQLVDIEFAQITSGAVFAAKKCDVAMGAITINDKRKKAVSFSVPYFKATQALITKKGAGIKSLADLKGKKVGVQTDTTGQAYAKEHAAANGYTMVVYDDLPTELTGLKAGQVDGAINDNGPVLDYTKSNPDTEVATEFNTNEQYGFVGQKDNANATKLMNVVSAQITASLKDGSYQKTYKKWFGKDPVALPDATS